MKHTFEVKPYYIATNTSQSGIVTDGETIEDLLYNITDVCNLIDDTNIRYEIDVEWAPVMIPKLIRINPVQENTDD